MLNLIENNFVENEEIILPNKERITLPPLTLALTLKYQNALMKFKNIKKPTQDQALKINKTVLGLIIEWLNTNTEGKEISMKFIEENFNSKQLTALIEYFGNIITDTEKKQVSQSLIMRLVRQLLSVILKENLGNKMIVLKPIQVHINLQPIIQDLTLTRLINYIITSSLFIDEIRGYIT